MTAYAVRRRRADEASGTSRWVIHTVDRPLDVRGSALTKWGATRLARRWSRMNAAASRSYPV